MESCRVRLVEIPPLTVLFKTAAGGGDSRRGRRIELETPRARKKRGHHIVPLVLCPWTRPVRAHDARLLPSPSCQRRQGHVKKPRCVITPRGMELGLLRGEVSSQVTEDISSNGRYWSEEAHRLENQQENPSSSEHVLQVHGEDGGVSVA